jgi:hypothetical protein
VCANEIRIDNTCKRAHEGWESIALLPLGITHMCIKKTCTSISDFCVRPCWKPVARSSKEHQTIL